MSRLLVGLVLLVALFAGGLWLLREPPPAAGEPRTPVTARRSVEAPAAASAPGSAGAGEARAQRLREGAAARANKLRSIREAIAAREASQRRTGAVVPEESGAAAVRRRAAAEPGEEEAPAITPLVDRTGNHAYLARVLSEELLPLVAECEQLARARQPGLAGLLNLNVEILGDEELGGVIDSLETAADNEVVDPGMIECVRESLLATVLPAPDQGGRDSVMLSLRIGPELDGAEGER